MNGELDDALARAGDAEARCAVLKEANAQLAALLSEAEHARDLYRLLVAFVQSDSGAKKIARWADVDDPSVVKQAVALVVEEGRQRIVGDEWR